MHDNLNSKVISQRLSDFQKLPIQSALYFRLQIKNVYMYDY